MKTKPSKKSKAEFELINKHAAGIDIGARFHVVAVAPDVDAEPVRSFSSFTADLHRMGDWLVQCKIKSVAMESTGIYWVPAFDDPPPNWTDYAAIFAAA